jgi:predicted nicotinamide N-methyase
VKSIELITHFLKYPTCIYQYQNKLSILIPEPASIKNTYDALVQKVADTPFPFWAKLWPASIALTDFLQSNTQWVVNKKVLEIGAGIGLPSFFIAKLASEILITDHAKDAVELMHENIKHLKLTKAQAKCLDWNHFPNEIKADTILLSDVNYAPEQFEQLLHLLKRFIAVGSTIILATPQRIMGVPFITSLASYITASHISSVKENEQTIDISILILNNNK